LEGRHLSRVHARIEKREGGLALVDQESRNGIFVNGKKVREHPLCADDEIEIGEFVLVFDPSFDPAAGIPERSGRTVAMVRETIADPFAEPLTDAGLLHIALETAHLLHSLEDERGAMKALLERVLANVRAPRGFVMLLDEAGKLAPIARSAPEHQDEFYVSSVLHHPVSRERRAILGCDIAKQGPHVGKSISILCAPIVSRNRYLGFLYLDGPRESTRFTTLDLQFVFVLASAAADVLIYRRKPPPQPQEWKSVEV
jgi:hypothetical protein